MPAGDDDTRTLAELAYELSLRTLGQQEAALNELRARTGNLIAAATLVASFLGATALDRSGFDGWSVAALISLVLSTVCAVRVLLPQGGLIFSLRGSALYEREADEDTGLAETYRRLAYWLEGFHDANEPLIDRQFVFYRLSVAALLVEVGCWSAQLALG